MRWWRRGRSPVRTRRIEVVGGDGRPWLVIGEAGASAVRGLWVLDAGGSQRLWLGVDGAGAGLAVGRRGTVVAGLGVHDAVPDAAHVGSYAFVGDVDGEPVAGWYVDDDAGLRIIGPG